MAERGPSRHETGVRFPPIRSSFRHSSQRTSATRCAPQAPHRIEATASRTRASSPCRATRAATGTSPQWPQPHRIRRLPPRRLPSRRPSRRNAMSSREAAPRCNVPAGRSSRDFSRASFAACFADGRERWNRPDAILCDERIRLDRLENAVIRFPSSASCQSLAPSVLENSSRVPTKAGAASKRSRVATSARRTSRPNVAAFAQARRNPRKEGRNRPSRRDHVRSAAVRDSASASIPRRLHDTYPEAGTSSSSGSSALNRRHRCRRGPQALSGPLTPASRTVQEGSVRSDPPGQLSRPFAPRRAFPAPARPHP